MGYCKINDLDFRSWSLTRDIFVSCSTKWSFFLVNWSQTWKGATSGCDLKALCAVKLNFVNVILCI